MSDLGQVLIGAGGHSIWARLGGGVLTSTVLVIFSLSDFDSCHGTMISGHSVMYHNTVEPL